ncbi:hypothetical protein [Aeromonas jandaei]|uniref:hypothetical protein n=1 Tax=Aeromonas jandaei TaxID=650 RepID=UPI0012DD9932|nr:hypothetical protein [Aeromonas jandaei]
MMLGKLSVATATVGTLAELKRQPQAGYIGIVVISQLADQPDDIAKCAGTNPFSGHHGE